MYIYSSASKSCSIGPIAEILVIFLTKIWLFDGSLLQALGSWDERKYGLPAIISEETEHRKPDRTRSWYIGFVRWPCLDFLKFEVSFLVMVH